MMRRIVKAVFWLALAAVLLLAAFVAVQYHRAPSLEPYRPLTLPAADKAAPGAVQVRFGGVATLVFDDGETAWMTDGFFSRPSVLATAITRIGPDAQRIDDGLRRMGVTRLAAVVPVHSHYDHAMDSPVVAQRTGARLIGSASTMHIGRGLGLPASQLQQVESGEPVRLGKFTLRFIASRHSPTPYSDGHSVERIDSDLVPPQRATAWREGTVWSIHVAHDSGRTWLVQGSAGFVPGALAGLRAETVFLGTGTLGKKPEAYREQFWNETVKAVGARQVVPIHWDNFWRPLELPLQAMPLLLDDFEVVMQDLQARGLRDGVRIRMPPLFVPFTL